MLKTQQRVANDNNENVNIAAIRSFLQNKSVKVCIIVKLYEYEKFSKLYVLPKIR